jgi:metallo-beta-lactamase family protein
MRITFTGAADTVTGSRHLIDLGGYRLLLDCGLFQGHKTLRLRNWAEPPFDPRSIDAVVLSHAHLDHCGYVPLLYKRGFRGRIFCTSATRDLAELLLLDSARLLEEEAGHANKNGYSRHSPAQPLYTEEDVRRCMPCFTPITSLSPTIIHKNVNIELVPAGHLLGASSIVIRHRKLTLAYSGDLGRPNDMLMPAPRPISQADILLVESTYGNRKHARKDVMSQLASIIDATASRGGVVLMPSFAVGRAQALLLAIHRLKGSGQMGDIPVFVDSHMASRATNIYRKHQKLLRIPVDEVKAACDGARFVASPEQSRRLSQSQYPCIIIAGSGMVTGGRILHHLKAHASDPLNHIVLPGFQVPGTRGAKMAAGEKSVRIHGQDIPLRAKVTQLEAFSGHADADEIMGWLKHLHEPPSETFIVHGERDAADAMRLRISHELNWKVHTVEHMQEIAL